MAEIITPVRIFMECAKSRFCFAPKHKKAARLLRKNKTAGHRPVYGKRVYNSKSLFYKVPQKGAGA